LSADLSAIKFLETETDTFVSFVRNDISVEFFHHWHSRAAANISLAVNHFYAVDYLRGCNVLGKISLNSYIKFKTFLKGRF
jgi:hypothetical protein